MPRKGFRGSARNAVKSVGGLGARMADRVEQRDPQLWEIMSKVSSGELTSEEGAAMIEKYTKGGIQEANDLSVSFQTGTGPNAGTTTKTVSAANPQQAVQQALQGQSMNGAQSITVGPTPQQGQPGAPVGQALPTAPTGQAPAPGMPMQPNPNMPNPNNPLQPNQNEGVRHVTAPDSFLSLVESMIEQVHGVTGFLSNGKLGMRLEDDRALYRVQKWLGESRDPRAEVLLGAFEKAAR